MLRRGVCVPGVDGTGEKKRGKEEPNCMHGRYPDVRAGRGKRRQKDKANRDGGQKRQRKNKRCIYIYIHEK